jgi:hypothetical protein
VDEDGQDCHSERPFLLTPGPALEVQLGELEWRARAPGAAARAHVRELARERVRVTRKCAKSGTTKTRKCESIPYISPGSQIDDPSKKYQTEGATEEAPDARARVEGAPVGRGHLSTAEVRTGDASKPSDLQVVSGFAYLSMSDNVHYHPSPPAVSNTPAQLAPSTPPVSAGTREPATPAPRGKSAIPGPSLTTSKQVEKRAGAPSVTVEREPEWLSRLPPGPEREALAAKRRRLLE